MKAAVAAALNNHELVHVLCATCIFENTGAFNYCSHCGAQPYRSPPISRDPRAQSVVIDANTLQARRAAILAKIESRPGQQQRKRKISDEFSPLLRFYSGGCRGCKGATADDVFN